jgi:AraC-like DNA-binding protein
MDDEHPKHPKGFSTWHRTGLPDHAPIAARLPVAENSITQVGEGPHVSGATIVSNTEVTVAHSWIQTDSVGTLVLKPGLTGFFAPLSWKGDLRVNGVMASATAMHMPDDGFSYHIRGRQREILGCVLPCDPFIETVAALRGVGPETLTLRDRALELAPAQGLRLRRGLSAILDEARRVDLGGEGISPFDLTNALFELMASAYLCARPESVGKSGRLRNPGRIVRAAEERFAQAGEGPVSLADLCAAAGVSKSGLYVAFKYWCGMPPIAYFQKRRLTRARTKLLRAEHQRGAIKRAALDVGLTELGRFSRDYRRLFGESPSATVNRKWPAG